MLQTVVRTSVISMVLSGSAVALAGVAAKPVRDDRTPPTQSEPLSLQAESRTAGRARIAQAGESPFYLDETAESDDSDRRITEDAVAARQSVDASNTLELSGEWHVNEHLTVGPGIVIGLDDNDETPDFGAGMRFMIAF